MHYQLQPCRGLTMIRYSLRCINDHRFESWFRSAGAFDSLRSGGHLSCPECGAGEVDKALMAPRVHSTRGEPTQAKAQPEQPEAPLVPVPAQVEGGKLAAPASEREAAIAEIRRRVEAHSEYVGLGFAAESRRIHSGEADARPIYGEARPDEARALIEEGLPIVPLPFLPSRRSN